MIDSGNVFAPAPPADQEVVTTLARFAGARIERIVSTGQASPPGFWYDQLQREWVVLLKGAAALRIDGEVTARRLRPGDFVDIPAHVRHRVEETSAAEPTIWLAIHAEDTD